MSSKRSNRQIKKERRAQRQLERELANSSVPRRLLDTVAGLVSLSLRAIPHRQARILEVNQVVDGALPLEPVEIEPLIGTEEFLRLSTEHQITLKNLKRAWEASDVDGVKSFTIRAWDQEIAKDDILRVDIEGIHSHSSERLG